MCLAVQNGIAYVVEVTNLAFLEYDGTFYLATVSDCCTISD